jgi:intracellular sulfur oxidation DsrE/DsrF family protein/thioredoxin-related protein
MKLYTLACLLCLFGPAALIAGTGTIEDDDFDLEAMEFSDAPRTRDLPHPDWFKVSFLDLPEDLAEAVAAGKRGIILYFGQKHCPYCKAHLVNNWERPDIVAYTRKHFDVIGMDIHGDQLVTDFDGQEMTEREFALLEGIDFTPTLDFYDRRGELVMRLRGYYPPQPWALHLLVAGYRTSDPCMPFIHHLAPGRYGGEARLCAPCVRAVKLIGYTSRKHSLRKPMPRLSAGIMCLLPGMLLSLGDAGAGDAATTDDIFGEPEHKVVYQLNQADPDYMNHVLFSVGAMLRKHEDNIHIVVTVIGPGIHLLGKRPERPVPKLLRQRAESLAMYGVEFHACGNTMKSLGWTQDDLLDFATVVEVGADDLMQLQEQGYAYIAW